MSFKLGQRSGPIAVGGRIIKKQLNKVSREDLGDGILGEARMDGAIAVDNSVEPGSPLDKKVQAHEGVHADEIAEGRISYEDDYVEADGVKHPRKNGKILYKGRWLPEGDSAFPWEQRAIAAEKNADNYA